MPHDQSRRYVQTSMMTLLEFFMCYDRTPTDHSAVECQQKQHLNKIVMRFEKVAYFKDL